jgi:hypothetical protein
MTRRILGRSNFLDFFWGGGWVFLLGVLENLGGLRWFFDGEIVVDAW